jgi:hypothetical protein
VLIWLEFSRGASRWFSSEISPGLVIFEHGIRTLPRMIAFREMIVKNWYFFCDRVPERIERSRIFGVQNLRFALRA